MMQKGSIFQQREDVPKPGQEVPPIPSSPEVPDNLPDPEKKDPPPYDPSKKEPEPELLKM